MGSGHCAPKSLMQWHTLQYIIPWVVVLIDLIDSTWIFILNILFEVKLHDMKNQIAEKIVSIWYFNDRLGKAWTSCSATPKWPTRFSEINNIATAHIPNWYKRIVISTIILKFADFFKQILIFSKLHHKLAVVAKPFYVWHFTNTLRKMAIIQCFTSDSENILIFRKILKYQLFRDMLTAPD